MRIERQPSAALLAAAHFQRELIARALRAARGQLGEAAQRLGLSRHALRHQMGKLGMHEAEGGTLDA